MPTRETTKIGNGNGAARGLTLTEVEPGLFSLPPIANNGGSLDVSDDFEELAQRNKARRSIVEYFSVVLRRRRKPEGDDKETSEGRT